MIGLVHVEPPLTVTLRRFLIKDKHNVKYIKVCHSKTSTVQYTKKQLRSLYKIQHINLLSQSSVYLLGTFKV